MTKIIATLLLTCLCTDAFADRISGTVFAQGTIIEKGGCNNLTAEKMIPIAFKTDDGHILIGNITSHTAIYKLDLTDGQCSDLSLNQPVRIGYAQGNDTGSIDKEFIVIDSIIEMLH
mgnify:CR=1 FL=1|tara:strand:- start:1187 stop:1537 length:351 start_codon:yes stop_codon:yes gene_type:complete